MSTLYCREYHSAPATAPTLVLLHGLFGSSANWHGIARRFQDRFHILSPDLRNHGRSPHEAGMTYPAMAADLTHLLDQHELDSVYLVGHSMGGKLAMWLALHHPQRIKQLVSVDMAPVKYHHSFADILSALESISLRTLPGRRDADAKLALSLDSAGLRAFLLQNLVKQNDAWHWRINLPALRENMAAILDFPADTQDLQFLGDTLFIYGGKSDYLNPRRAEQAKRYFPYARLRMIPQAGHWVYAEAPDDFFKILDTFLTK